MSDASTSTSHADRRNTATSTASATLLRCCHRCGGPLPRDSETTLCALCAAIDGFAEVTTHRRASEQVVDTIANLAQYGWTYALCDMCGTPVPDASGPVQCMDCMRAEVLRSFPLVDEVELARTLASQGILPDAKNATRDAHQVVMGLPSRAMCQMLGLPATRADQLFPHYFGGDNSQLARDRRRFGGCYVHVLAAPLDVIHDRPPAWIQQLPFPTSEPQTVLQWRAWHAEAPGYLLRIWYDPATGRELSMRYGRAEPHMEQAVAGYLALVRAGGILPLRGAPRGGEIPARETFIAQMRTAYTTCQQENFQGPLRHRGQPRQEDVAAEMDIPYSTFRRRRKQLDIPYPPPPPSPPPDLP